MKVVLYARVSTDDKGQNPETQILALREALRGRPWEISREYVDQASARDLARRTAWRDLLADARRRRFHAVAVFKLDRAFRSLLELHQTLAEWDSLGVQLICLDHGFDSSTAAGRLVLAMLASVAVFELELVRERTRAGLARARREGKRIGRPPKRRGPRWARTLALVTSGELSRRAAAREMRVSEGTVRRWLRNNGGIAPTLDTTPQNGPRRKGTVCTR